MQLGQLHWLVSSSLSTYSNIPVVKPLEEVFAFHNVVFAFGQSTPTIQWNSNNPRNISSPATMSSTFSPPSSIVVHGKWESLCSRRGSLFHQWKRGLGVPTYMGSPKFYDSCVCYWHETFVWDVSIRLNDSKSVFLSWFYDLTTTNGQSQANSIHE